MSLDRVVEEIRQRGRREADETVEAARREREEALADAQREGEALIEERKREARKEAERERTREMARAELESRKIVLRAQKEVLDEVLARAKERLRDRQGERGLLKALVEAHRDELADATVRCNEADAPVLRELTEGEVQTDLETLGGFVIESKAGDLRIDLTYESFLEEVWEDAVRELADILWEGG